MKKFWDYIFPEYKFSDVMLIEGTFEHLGFYKPRNYNFFLSL